MINSDLPFGRVLVTGARGFVGRYLVPALAQLLPPGGRLIRAVRREKFDGSGPRDTVLFDLADPGSVADAIARVQPDLIIHLAGQASVGAAAGRAAETWQVNFGGSFALAEALAKAAPTATLLFASSVETYGLTFRHEVAREGSPLQPQSPYARSKAATEAMFADVLPAAARLIVARPCNHSGPGQAATYVIPAFAAQIAQIELGLAGAVRVGNLDPERDFLDVRDVIAAYLALLGRASALPMRSIFNIATGTPVSIGTILDRLCAMSTAKIVVEQDPARMRPSEVKRAAIDVTAIREAVGWMAMRRLDDVLAAVLADARLRAAE